MNNNWPEPIDEIPTEKHIPSLRARQRIEDAARENGVVYAAPGESDQLKTDRIITETYWAAHK